MRIAATALYAQIILNGVDETTLQAGDAGLSLSIRSAYFHPLQVLKQMGEIRLRKEFFHELFRKHAHRD